MNTKLSGKSDTHSHPYLNTANVANNLTTTSAGYALDARQGKTIQDRINTINNTIGTIYTCNITNAHAPQKTICFGSMEIPSGTYIITGSAKHSTSGGICKIGIGTSFSSMPTDNGQIIYGNAGYDVNMGSVSIIVNITTPTIFYFQTWAASDFEIIPIMYKAIRIK